ncbi:MAG: aldehyde dehydrogenase family protein [Bacteroidetes bacterium]|nr:aldehyde dehydrogenase family protein [Bacteroidota bacterium]
METKKLYIGGEWVDGPLSKPNINPSNTADIIAEYACGQADQVQQAVAAATSSWPTWAASTPQQRFNVLDFVGTELLQRAEELGTLLSREEGKTLPEGIGEVQRAGYLFKFFAGEALRNSGELVQSVRPGVWVDSVREPIGVVGIVTPWNFPIAIPAWKIAPALAFGNAVVFKPAELVPGSAWALAEILSRSGLPKGVFNLVIGKGSQIGKVLVEHPDIAGITFTGSIEVGGQIAAACGRNMKKVQLEMGGKNPLVVLDDADLDVAVQVAIQGSYFSTGQRCTASSRLIVTEKIHNAFVSAMIEKLGTITVGDALKKETHIGPVVDQSQLDKDLEYIRSGVSEGARLACGGEVLKRDAPGYFLAPALFTDSRPEMRINREEIFGPVASIIRVKTYEEALEMANDTPFGLTSGICTKSLKHAQHFKQHAQAGMVMINLPTAGVDYHVPFGGRKASSYGPREQGSYAKEFYTTVKTTYTMAG